MKAIDHAGFSLNKIIFVIRHKKLVRDTVDRSRLTPPVTNLEGVTSIRHFRGHINRVISLASLGRAWGLEMAIGVADEPTIAFSTA
jgi:hypothetical protein